MSLLIKNIILEGKRRDIFIEENKIKKIGENLNFKAKEKIDGKGEKAIIAGFVNCHCHSAMILFRGYADDLPLNIWLKEKIWPLESQLTQDDVYWGTKMACLEMIKSGTTTFNEMYWFEESQYEAIKEMGMRAKIGLVMLDFLPWGSKEKVVKIFHLLKSHLEKIPITFSIAPHSIYTVSRENLIWAKDFAKKNNLLLHIHLSETEKEVKDCLKKFKLRPVDYLEKIGFLNENCILAHSIWLNEKEIKILKKRKCSVVYNPCSNLKLASGIFPFKKLKRNKINIALGTDGASSNNNLDMIKEMKFASLLQKGIEKDPTIISAKEIFKIATKNGAKALKINGGEIKEKKLADLVLIDLNKIYFKPGHNFISDLIYSASGDCVSDVICNGKILMKNRKIEGEEKIIKEATKRAKNLIKTSKRISNIF